jgi:hypothetical protein
MAISRAGGCIVLVYRPPAVGLTRRRARGSIVYLWSASAAIATPFSPPRPMPTGAQPAAAHCRSAIAVPPIVSHRVQLPRLTIAASCSRAGTRWVASSRRSRFCPITEARFKSNCGANAEGEGASSFGVESDRFSQPRLPLIEGPEPIRLQLQRAGHVQRVEGADAENGTMSASEIVAGLPSLGREFHCRPNRHSAVVLKGIRCASSFY